MTTENIITSMIGNKTIICDRIKKDKAEQIQHTNGNDMITLDTICANGSFWACGLSMLIAPAIRQGINVISPRIKFKKLNIGINCLFILI